MGTSSSRAARARSQARSDEIDRQIGEDSLRLKKQVSILLLGPDQSGKSTLVKHLKIAHQQGFTTEELLAYRSVIHQNVIQSAQALVLALRTFGLEPLAKEHRHLPDVIAGARPEEPLSSDTADAIKVLLWDSAASRVLDEHWSELHLTDSAFYFLNQTQRLAQPNYHPTEEDVLHTPPPTSRGLTETRFCMGALSIVLIDAGSSRSERRKWIHCFESVNSIIFCTALSDYDQTVPEEPKRNRMWESLFLFESIVNSRWFLRTSIILFLTELHVLKAKISKLPLGQYFPEYTGGPDLQKAAKFILWRFMQENRARLSVYPHLTARSSDMQNFRLIMAAVKETILQRALKDLGIKNLELL
ncbi:heterotrimeric G protein alpha subunit A [Mycena galopus ATCC 62051]|nr:heterotrimeric G protein alpha subunit A [Mycena galopus ATCC 62051]